MSSSHEPHDPSMPSDSPAMTSSHPAGGSPARRRRPLLLGMAAAVLVLALLVVLAVRHHTANKKAAEPAAAVQGYLEALAAGDATKALSYADNPPPASDLLTNDALKQALKDTPITDITTSGPDGDRSSAAVTYGYKLGDTQVHETMPLKKVNGTWKLTKVANEVVLGNEASQKAPELINGVKYPDGGDLFLFPGRYTVTSSSPFVSYSNNEFVVDSPTRFVTVTGLRATLDEAGKQAYRDAVRKKFAACLAARTLAPAACGFDGERSMKVAGNTITRTIDPSLDDMVNGLPAQLSPLDLTIYDRLAGMITVDGKDASGAAVHALEPASEVHAVITEKGIDVTLGS